MWLQIEIPQETTVGCVQLLQDEGRRGATISLEHVNTVGVREVIITLEFGAARPDAMNCCLAAD